jgi:hypothetical protein
MKSQAETHEPGTKICRISETEKSKGNWGRLEYRVESMENVEPHRKKARRRETTGSPEKEIDGGVDKSKLSRYN